jgi:hypothetical protein
MEGAAGGVDAVLEPGERMVALLEGIGAPVEVLRAGSEELIPQGTLDRVEAAKVPFAHDDLVEEATRLGGSGRMAGVVFVLKFLEIFKDVGRAGLRRKRRTTLVYKGPRLSKRAQCLVVWSTTRHFSSATTLYGRKK